MDVGAEDRILRKFLGKNSTPKNYTEIALNEF